MTWYPKRLILILWYVLELFQLNVQSNYKKFLGNYFTKSFFVEKLFLLSAYLFILFQISTAFYNIIMLIGNKRLKNHLTPLVLLSARVFSWCISDVPRDYSNLKMQKPSNLCGCTCLSSVSNQGWACLKSVEKFDWKKI